MRTCIVALAVLLVAFPEARAADAQSSGTPRVISPNPILTAGSHDLPVSGAGGMSPEERQIALAQEMERRRMLRQSVDRLVTMVHQYQSQMAARPAATGENRKELKEIQKLARTIRDLSGG